MSFLKKLQNIVRSNLNDFLDAVEDPQKILDLSIEEMRETEKATRRKLLEIKALQNLNNDQKIHVKDLEESLAQLKQQIKAAKQKRDELTKKIMRAKILGRKQDLNQIVKEAKDYVNDTKAFDTYDRMVEKIEYSESYTAALKEIHELETHKKNK